MTNNNPPFAIGQKVVCVNDKGMDPCFRDPANLTEDVVYIVTNECYYTGIKGVYISINGFNVGYLSSRFAPYDPPAVEIDEEIIEQAKDMVNHKETILVNEAEIAK